VTLKLEAVIIVPPSALVKCRSQAIASEGYSDDEDEENGAEESTHNRHPLLRGKLGLIELHAGKQQHCEGGRQQERHTTRHG